MKNWKLVLKVGLVMLVMFFLEKGWGQVTYYSQSTLSTFNELSKWGTNTDGTGTTPLSISDADNFIISNNATVTSLGSSVTVRNLTITSGSSLTVNSTLVLTCTAPSNGVITVDGSFTVGGSSTSAIVNCTALTITSNGSVTYNSSAGSGTPFVVSGTFTINNGGTYTHSTGRSANLGSVKSFSNNSNFVYTTSTFLSSPTYGNLRCNGSSLTMNAATVTIAGNLIVSSGTVNLQSTSNGNVSIGGGILLDGGNLVGSSGAGSSTIIFTNTGLASGNISINSGTFSPQNITVNIGRTVGLSNNISIPSSKSLMVNGILDCGTTTISGSGSFTLSTGATLITSNSNGISGSIAVTGTITFDIGANYEFQGNSTGTFPSSPFTVNNLVINRSGGDVSLGQDIVVAGSLNLLAGRFNLGAFDLTSNTIINAPAWGEHCAKYIIAESSGSLSSSAGTNIIFPIGTSSDYMPCRINGGSGAFAVNLSNPNSGLDETKILKKQWNISNIITSSPDISFQWPSNVNVEGSNFPVSGDIKLFKYSNSSWSIVTSASAPSGSIKTVTFPAVNCCSGFVPGAEQALPVELVYFNANQQQTSTLLTWQTASELNNSHFAIERSTDGAAYREIGEVLGNGNSLTLNNYQFLDERPATGINYYRLRQVDFDGQFEYSRVVTVFFGEREGDVQLYPTLASDEVILRFSKPTVSNGNFLLYSQNGRLVRTVDFEEETTEVRMDVSTLPSGNYYVRVQSGRLLETLRFMRQRMRV